MRRVGMLHYACMAAQAWQRWWHLHRQEALRDLMVAVLVAVPIATATYFLDREMASRQEVLENTRFIRDRAAADPDGLKPFNGLNLHDAFLAGLKLNCYLVRAPEEGQEEPQPPSGENEGCADLRSADLSEAYLTGIELRGADLRGADFTGANLRAADLRGADMTGAFFTDADLTGAKLEKSYVNSTDFTDADFTDVVAPVICYDEKTRWPEGFTPASVRCLG